MTTSIPTNQILYNTKLYQQENAYLNSTDPKVYLTRYLNTLLRSVARSSSNYSNKIIGCDTFFVDLINTSIFKVVISPGQVIIDSTLVEFKTPTFLDIDLSSYSDYDEVLVICAYQYLENQNKAKLQIILRNSITDAVTSNSPLLTSLPYLIVGRFKIIRNNNVIIKIEHPYGQWLKSFYSDFLKSISYLAVAVNNIVFEKLIPNIHLYESFLIDGRVVQLNLPVYLDMDTIDTGNLSKNILFHYLQKTQPRYFISDTFTRQYSKRDRNLTYKAEMFTDDKYNHSI